MQLGDHEELTKAMKDFGSQVDTSMKWDPSGTFVLAESPQSFSYTAADL